MAYIEAQFSAHENDHIYVEHYRRVRTTLTRFSRTRIPRFYPPEKSRTHKQADSQQGSSNNDLNRLTVPILKPTHEPKFICLNKHNFVNHSFPNVP